MVDRVHEVLDLGQDILSNQGVVSCLFKQAVMLKVMVVHQDLIEP